jgi:hypothetical protein
MRNIKTNPKGKKGGIGSRPSNRVYPRRNCKKPSCNVEFIPTSKKQVYCIPQHRIDHNNDQRTSKDKLPNAHVKKLAHNQEVLKKIYNRLAFNNQDSFSIQLLQYELYNFGIHTGRSINEQSGNEIEWAYQYGIEPKDAATKTFIIHFRKAITQ